MCHMKIKCSPCEYGINDPRAITVVVQFLDVRHLSNQFCFHRHHHSLLVIEYILVIHRVALHRFPKI